MVFDILRTEAVHGPASAAESPIRNNRAPTEPVLLKVTLGIEFGMTGEEGSGERESFKREVAADLAAASCVPSATFQLYRVSPGSVILDVDIIPGSGPDPLFVAADLKLQAADPTSVLRSGKHTRHITGIEVMQKGERVEGELMQNHAASGMKAEKEALARKASWAGKYLEEEAEAAAVAAKVAAHSSFGSSLLQQSLLETAAPAADEKKAEAETKVAAAEKEAAEAKVAVLANIRLCV
jgi:hypothetical protein